MSTLPDHPPSSQPRKEELPADKGMGQLAAAGGAEVFSALIANAPFGVFVVDSQLRVRVVNKGAEALFRGLEPLLERDLAQLARLRWSERFASDAVARFRHTLATGEPYVAPPPSAACASSEKSESYDWRLQRLTLPDGTPGVVCYFYELTAIRRADAVVANAARRDAFLAQLADAMRPLTSAQEITRVAAELLGQHLEAGQVMYADVDDSGEYAIIEHEWNAGSMPSFVGRHRMRDFGLLTELKRGEVLVVPDVRLDPRTASGPASQSAESRSIGAFLNVPLVKDGRLVAVLAVHYHSSRAWLPAEIELTREVAERTWSAVERARAELDLGRTQARLAAALDAGLAGTFFWDIPSNRIVTDANMQAYFALSDRASGKGLPLERVLLAIDEEDRPRVTAALQEATERTGIYQIEYRAIHADGSRRWLSVRGLVERDERGAAVGMPGFAVDITRIKDAEAALRESEAKYHSLFDSIDEGFCILQMIYDDQGKAVDYHYVETNRIFEELTGFKPMGRTARQMLPNLENWWIDAWAKVVRTREAVRFENHNRARDRWYDVYASPVGSQASGQVAVVFNDITERKRRDANAAFLADLSEALLNVSTPADIVRVLGERVGSFFGAAGCTFTNINEAKDEAAVSADWHPSDLPSLVGSYRLSDYVTDELRQTLAADRPTVVRDVRADSRITEQQRLAARRIRSFINVPLVRDNRWRFVLGVYHDEPYDWRADEVAVMLEATMRVWNRLESARAEASLRETEARLQQALAASNMGTFVWHVNEDRGEPDARMLRLFGLPEDGTLSLAMALATMIHPEDRERYASAIRAAMSPEGSGVLREDLRVVHKDGSVHWLALTGQMVFAGSPPQAVRLVGLAADITQRKLTEEALREREERLKDTDRRKDEFLAVLAHELRNPLAPIRTGLEFIRLAGNAPGAIERARSMMERQVGHMVRLIDDLLDVSRITSGKIRMQRQLTPLVILVSTAIEAHRAALQAGRIELEVELPPLPVSLDVDPTRFVQVVSNVLHNAVKFTEPAGRIRITAALQPAAAGEAQELVLRVTDTGSGISSEMLPRVFDLFVQDDTAGQRAHTGLGIGLALARRLMEMHGGAIEAHSDGPGRGSTFTMRLPLERSSAPAVAASPPQGASAVQCRVGVIDDNRDAADMMAMLVQALGGEAWVAYDGESGIAKVRMFRPDVVLLDIGMPGIDGYETCRRLREELGSELTIVALTGWGQEQDKQEAAEAGFNAHLTKPASPAALEQLLAGAAAARSRAS